MKPTALFDSWAWIEISNKSDKVYKLRKYYGHSIIISTINCLEVYSKLSLENPVRADEFVDYMLEIAEPIWVSQDLAIRAAQFKRKYKFSMADAIILATAEYAGAKLVTGDPDFKDVSEVAVEII